MGPDGDSTPLGQRHSNSQAVAAEAGGGVRLNPATGLFEQDDGSAARRMAGVPTPAATAEMEDTPDTQPPKNDLDTFAQHVEAAEAGDDASKLVIQGAAAQARGEIRLALELYERAARLGQPQGMYEAGMIHREIGDRQSAAFWFEAAANAGISDAYGHLANLSEAEGDPSGEREWSRRGAEAGHAWSMGNFAYFLLMDAQQGVQSGAEDSEVMQVLRQCLDYATRAANLGQVNAMYSAGLANVFLNRPREALDWLRRAEQHGHPNARRMIEQLNLS